MRTPGLEKAPVRGIKGIHLSLLLFLFHNYL
jgi:hypothetical protein